MSTLASQRWQRICLDCWQAVNPTEYQPEASDVGACTACGDPYAPTISVHPETAREAAAARIADVIARALTPAPGLEPVEYQRQLAANVLAALEAAGLKVTAR